MKNSESHYICSDLTFLESDFLSDLRQHLPVFRPVPEQTLRQLQIRLHSRLELGRDGATSEKYLDLFWNKFHLSFNSFETVLYIFSKFGRTFRRSGKKI